MTRAVARSLAVLLAFVAVGLGGEVVGFWVCGDHRALGRAVILDDGFAVARPDEALFACTVRHCLVGDTCHDDARCVCAPSEMAPAEVGRRVDGACTVDHARPRRDDGDGRCRRARCNQHLAP